MEKTLAREDQFSAQVIQRRRTMLIGGLLAGPLYVAVGLLQILIRPGYDVTRNDLSLLSNGALGWIQIANFLLTGLLVIAGAVGMRQAMRGTRGGTWAPILVGLYGLGLMGAGVFVADPMNGFPPGTPPGPPANPSGHGLLHLVSGAIGFLGLIAACFVFARRFAASGQRGWALYSTITGVVFFAAFFGIAAGSQQGGTTLVLVTVAFTIAVLLAWTWLSLMAVRLMDAQANPTSR